MAPELQLYATKLFKFWQYNAKRRISGLWQSSAILWHVLHIRIVL